jgi:hypothetical protein
MARRWSARPLGTRRGAIALSAMLAASAALVLAPGAAGAQTSGDEGRIQVVHRPAAAQGVCLPAPLALGRTVHSDETSFRLRITTAAPLCEPISAVAAVYAMPGNGAAWPQRLVETTPFTISEAGEIDVTFTKTCAPVQFDVITGETPAVISPLGGVPHGPLLFPFDTATSQQHWGWPCESPTTTTTTGPGVTTPPAPTTTTTLGEPAVLGATTTSTVLPVAVVSEVNPRPQVLGSTQNPSQPAALAYTGLSLWSAMLAAMALIFGGLSLLSMRRARPART